MDRLQFAARNKANHSVSGGTKRQAKRYYEKSCTFCGYRNNCNLNQKNTRCAICKNIY